MSFHPYSPVYCSRKNPSKGMFSSPREAELGSPHAAEICGKGAQALNLTTGWCETLSFSKVCKQLCTEKLDQKCPRKCLFGQKFLSQWLKPKRPFLCCEIHSGRGTLWTWTRRAQGCTFCPQSQVLDFYSLSQLKGFPLSSEILGDDQLF